MRAASWDRVGHEERIMKEHFGQEYQVISGRPAGFFRESEARLLAKWG